MSSNIVGEESGCGGGGMVLHRRRNRVYAGKVGAGIIIVVEISLCTLQKTIHAI